MVKLDLTITAMVRYNQRQITKTVSVSVEHGNLLNYYQTFKISDNLFKFDLFIRELLGIISFKMFL